MRKKLSRFLRRPIVKWTLIGLAAVLALSVLIHLDRAFGWTGYGSYRHPQTGDALWGKTLWDWLELLIVPIMLVIGGLL